MEVRVYMGLQCMNFLLAANTPEDVVMHFKTSVHSFSFVFRMEELQSFMQHGKVTQR